MTVNTGFNRVSGNSQLERIVAICSTVVYDDCVRTYIAVGKFATLMTEPEVKCSPAIHFIEVALKE